MRWVKTGGLLVLVVLAAAGCSVSIGARDFHARASVFAPLNRDAKVDTADGAIVAGLLVEGSGDESLARAYLAAQGYTPAQAEKVIASAKATRR